MSGQLHTLAALYPGKEPQVPLDWRPGDTRVNLNVMV